MADPQSMVRRITVLFINGTAWARRWLRGVRARARAAGERLRPQPQSQPQSPADGYHARIRAIERELKPYCGRR